METRALEDKYSWWVKDIVKNLTLRYHAQGGTEHYGLKPWMEEDYNRILAEVGDDLEKIHDKAFKIHRND